MSCECPYKVEGWEQIHTDKCARDHYTYKELLARQTSVDPSKLADPSAKPKYSKGDTHRYRERLILTQNTEVDVRRIKIKRNKAKIETRM